MAGPCSIRLVMMVLTCVFRLVLLLSHIPPHGYPLEFAVHSLHSYILYLTRSSRIHN